MGETKVKKLARINIFLFLPEAQRVEIQRSRRIVCKVRRDAKMAGRLKGLIIQFEMFLSRRESSFENTSRGSRG